MLLQVSLILVSSCLHSSSRIMYHINLSSLTSINYWCEKRDWFDTIPWMKTERNKDQWQLKEHWTFYHAFHRLPFYLPNVSWCRFQITMLIVTPPPFSTPTSVFFDKCGLPPVDPTKVPNGIWIFSRRRNTTTRYQKRIRKTTNPPKPYSTSESSHQHNSSQI